MIADVRRLVQLALDLWDRSEPRAPAEAAAGQGGTRPSVPVAPPPVIDRSVVPSLQKVPDLVIPGVQPAPGAGVETPSAVSTKTVPPEPEPESLSHTLLPQAFEHPGANRAVLLGDTHIAYLLQRAKRRSIGFLVGEDGLVVRAPRWVTQNGIDEALQEKGAWIVRKLGEMQRRRAHSLNATIRWEDGATLPFLGQPLQLVIDSEQRVARAGAVWRVESELPGSPSRLYLALPRAAGREQIRDLVQAWFMKSARQHFLSRLAHFAPLLRVHYTSLRLSSAETRWGSAKSDGSIRLNWRLMHYTPAVIDYVVAHELAHLRVMDHSPRFWDTVAEVVPDHRALREQLKSIPAPPWDLAA
ncbi:M48 family metallopeptidase [Comamonas sp. 4034]|uniref:M48 family metallopeptidase n=1 Tax=Comamonas sp. 4034 TaxID=3156455 RepID=UPI003D1B6D95